ncbi:MAG: excinuclease ABC subunit UvrB [Bacilli bacterium]|nr:excinuclease ABC subunit UvrB [Mycoplasmatota bacterium]MDD6941984.1 excinuclease ABC subunit UvrB [bacterium]MDY2697776.1 excinuclease ABC subunit UvrB [Bacilli bacterium]MEE0014424.1 excinuclease ABC subunit UvrB [Bacilli bacterium]
MIRMFKLISKYKPSGDQPAAIEELVKGINEGKKEQVLLGATGTGKTFTVANVIAKVNKPTLVLAHNKTLAGQLYSELKELFPENKVEYFVSYYDYYQPEAYVPSTDTYIEKDSSINDEIDELRHAATSALLSRRDVIVVASVSCIYGIGEVEEYKNKMLTLSVGDKTERNQVLTKLVDMLYERNDLDFKRGTFRVRGDTLEIIPANQNTTGFRIEFFGDEIDRISEIDTLTGAIISNKKNISIFPASHFVVSDEKLHAAIERIKEELKERLIELKKENKLVAAERLEQRTNYDIEMLEETGFCSGIENYSAPMAGRKRGETPVTLMDFFPDDYLLVVDESHVTLPQVRGMYNGDRARKMNLVEYGFRLPSALDNRPLKYDEFEKKLNQVIYVSATPGDLELEHTNNHYVEQIIRPTGLLDPTVEVRKTEGQIDDLVGEIRTRIKKDERVLVTTLTIRMSEELTNYLKELDIKVAYLHSEVKTLERMQIIHDLRAGKYDVIVGINLLREGIDIPEVSLIAILDADKEGFLRSTRSLIQTIGRCARNASGHVIMYGDKITDSMEQAISETARRRAIQEKYNEEHNITPTTIKKEIREVISNIDTVKGKKTKKPSKKEQALLMETVEEEMREAARNLDFERAMELRDILFEMKSN